MHATGPKMRIASAISRVPEYIRPVHSVTGTPAWISAATASASLGCTSPSEPKSVPSISVTKTRLGLKSNQFAVLAGTAPSGYTETRFLVRESCS